MKSIVVVAYYHLMHAMALALTFDQKPNLYLCVEYTNMDDGVVENIRKCGVFNEVIKLDTREFIFDFVPELRKTKKAEPEEIREIGSSLFDEYIDAYYYPKFQGADFDEEIYIYTEYHLMMYSISKHFNNIVHSKAVEAAIKVFVTHSLPVSAFVFSSHQLTPEKYKIYNVHYPVNYNLMAEIKPKAVPSHKRKYPAAFFIRCLREGTVGGKFSDKCSEKEHK